MAYAEKRGNTWRVKYSTSAGERSRSGFPDKQSALDWGREQEAEIRRRRWRDPRSGDITVEAWIAKWRRGQDLAETTDQNYRYMIRRHILPAFGAKTLNELERMDIEAWEKGIRDRKFSPSVAAKARSVFATILNDAVEEGYLAANPATKKRGRGRQDLRAAKTAESLWLNEHQVLAAAERASMISGRPDEFVWIILAAYTGMRGAELRGLQRRFCRLREIRVEWQLREVDGKTFVAPPKHNSRRTIPLPPFLVALMSDHLQRVPQEACECHGADFVFRNQEGGHQLRTNFTNRYWRPAVDGLPVPRKGQARLPLLVDEEGRMVYRKGRGRISREGMERLAVASWLPILPDATPHDLRHSHKTWMIDDGIPEVAQFERLGHKLTGIREIYSHVTAEFRDRILDGLERRMTRALKARARKGPSAVPVLQELLELHLGRWELSSQIPPIGGAKIITMPKARAS